MKKLSKVGDALLVAVALASVGSWGTHRVRLPWSGSPQAGVAEATVPSSVCGASGGYCVFDGECPPIGYHCFGGAPINQGQCCTAS